MIPHPLASTAAGIVLTLVLHWLGVSTALIVLILGLVGVPAALVVWAYTERRQESSASVRLRH